MRCADRRAGRRVPRRRRTADIRDLTRIGRDGTDEIGSARRHAGRVERADHDGRWRGAARGRVPSARRWPPSGDPEQRPLREGTRIQGRLPGELGTAGEVRAGSARRFQQQVPDLGTGRPREVGAGGLCLRARGLARGRLLAGGDRLLVGARSARPGGLHRMGGRAGLEQRQGRRERHLVLRDEPVAGRGASAKAPGRAVPVGGVLRLLPRTVPPRRHPVRLPRCLVPAAGHLGAVRRRRARREECRDR